MEREAITFGTDRLAGYLQEALGRKVVAYLAGLKDPKMVGAWARGSVKPRDTVALRLRYAYQPARILVNAYGDETAKAWFFGTNHMLDDEAPAYVLRHARTPDEIRLVVPAARSFVGSAG